MKKFLLKSLLFLSIAISLITFLLMQYGGYIDYFYNKFTTPKAKSMILGDSRSFQGIQPKIIDKYLYNSNYELPMMNYSFTIAQISYDSLYLNSIKKKLNPLTKTGLFILSVHPWVLSKRDNQSMENFAPPHNMNNVTINPNFEYLIKNFNYFHFKAIFRQNSYLHKDGWLEERNISSNKKTLSKWKKKQINMYKSFSKKWKPSKKHLNSLNKIITFLKKHGTVILIRMPVNNEIIKIENNYWNSFEKDIIKLSKENKIKYISFEKDSLKYKTYDGNHIDKFGGVYFSKDLSKIINKN